MHVRLGLAVVLALAASACSSASVDVAPTGRVRPDPQTATAAIGSLVSGEQKAHVVAETAKEPLLEESAHRCPNGMVDIEGRFCIDKYEASIVEVLGGGEERATSPYQPVDGKKVRAVSEANVHPQGYISANQASRACANSGKRLCRAAEWKQACQGPERRAYGYGDHREVGRCNDSGKNPVMTLYGPRWTSSTMNQPTLNQMKGTLAKTGEHAGCTNGYGVYDMVGNLHEWVSDASFHGGYYLDVSSFGHGEGCGYVTTAHAARYHDYSTGFRCCADTHGESTSAGTATSPARSPRR